MAVTHLPLEDVETLVSRPVVLAVTKSLLDHLQINPKTRVYYNGSAEEVALQPGSTLITGADPQAGINTWANDESVKVEVTMGHSKERIGGYTNTSLATALFADTNINFYSSPVYFTQDVQLRVTYKATSRASADSWRQLMMQRYRDGFDMAHHTASYTYLLPDFFIALSSHMFELMQTQAPYEGLDYRTWFYKHCSTKIGPVTNQGGTKSAIGVSEKQVGIMTSFDESPVDVKSEKVDNTNAYTTELLFRFNFDKPYVLRVEYPTVVHNSVVNPIFIPQYDQYTSEDFIKDQFSSMQGLSFYSSNQMDNMPNAMLGLVIPQWDDYRVKYTLPDTATILTALCTISQEDPYTLLDLKDLGDVVMAPELLKWLSESEYASVTGRPTSVLIASLYEGDTLCSNESLAITKDCLVVSKNPLNLRKVYHVRLAFYTNIYTVGYEAHQRLVESGMSPSFVHFLQFQTSGYNIGVESFNHTKDRPNLQDYWNGKYPLPSIRNWHGYYVQTFFKVSDKIKSLNPEANALLNTLGK